MRAADAALLIVSLMIVWSFYRAHRNSEFSFNVFDIIMEGGRVSKTSCILMGSFFVISWIMIRLTLDGKMSEGYLGLYGAVCFSPVLVRIFTPQSVPHT